MLSDGLGFVEVFLQCPLSTALVRNALRPVPIPPFTIEKLAQSAEPPDPKGHHWEEGRSMLLSTDCCWSTFIPGARFGRCVISCGLGPLL